MKIYSLYAGIETLAKMSNGKCVVVFWEPPTGQLYVCDCGEDEENAPDTSVRICAGQPMKFFNLLHQLLTHHVFHRDD